MDYILFKQWLQQERNMTARSAADVVSRCKRISKLLEKDSINENAVSELMKLECYNDMSSYIKSQLKRAATLYQEYTTRNCM